MEFIIEKRKPSGKDSLTKREKEILGYLIDGYTAPEIAVMLKRSKETIKTHRHNIYEKTGVDSHLKLLKLYLK